MLSVFDPNADGVVDQQDFKMFMSIYRCRDCPYEGIFDLNGDYKIDHQDLVLVNMDRGKNSTISDRIIARVYFHFRHLLIEDIYSFITLPDPILPFVEELFGHGIHSAYQSTFDGTNTAEKTWFTPSGFNVGYHLGVQGVSSLNASSTDEVRKMWGVFYGHSNAVPLFNNTETGHPYPSDYPFGSNWMNEVVVDFASDPPELEDFDVVAQERGASWHYHPGFCMVCSEEKCVVDVNADPLVPNPFGWADGDAWLSFQSTTFLECQAMDSYIKKTLSNGQVVNFWANIDMMHMWFVPNPYGVFGHTHPCVSVGAKSESDINFRPMPERFFDDSHSHH